MNQSQVRGKSRVPVEDHIAIEQLYARYTFALDLHDVEGWLGCWTVEGAMNHYKSGIIAGHAELRRTIEAVIGNPLANGYHWNTAIVLEPADYGVAGKCYHMYLYAPEGMGEVKSALYYRDQIVCREGEWKFLRRTIGPLGWEPAIKQIEGKGR